MKKRNGRTVGKRTDKRMGKERENGEVSNEK
jgi:hypothetical protein